MKNKSLVSHTILLVFAVFCSYFWIELTYLANISLQAFAVSILGYFILKKFNNTNIWHIAPTAMSIEIALATFAYLLLIGATGNTQSVFFPLTYVNLFFLVFSTQPITAIITTVAIMMFHYGLEESMTITEISSLVTLPIILFFFLFAKNQYQTVKQTEKQLQEEDELILQEEHSIISFIESFLKPRLNNLKQLSQTDPQQATSVINDIKQEVTLLEHHIEGFMANHTSTTTNTNNDNQNDDSE